MGMKILKLLAAFQYKLLSLIIPSNLSHKALLNLH